MIAIINSGVANFASVEAALARLGAETRITDSADDIGAADRVILPGVGSAEAAMTTLANRSLVSLIRALRQPVLGICLGMQLLFEHSEEGDQPCLGVIPGRVRKLLATPELPVPHMGWNRLIPCQIGNPLLRGFAEEDSVYFVHSFAADVSDDTVASASYGRDFAAIVQHDNFCGCQFHPERSGAVGTRILQNFLEM